MSPVLLAVSVRIVAGHNKGTRLTVPAGRTVRPTPDRVREALFSILGDRIHDARVLDLFAGSGALGLEAMSRGAKEATFVERDREALKALTRNIEACRWGQGEVQVLRREVAPGLRSLRGKEPFDWVFMDPPYGQGLVAPTLDLLADYLLLATDGEIVVDHPSREEISDGKGWSVVDRRVYGETALAWVVLRESEEV